ncbi:hypothetical protein niasHS_016405 [Heterodera schachtii]|uniref:Uncharacterized protein n=1 Tax=Heterodera schachtii TaxID=97005 RepID=A0ABD2HPR5_HETSC
MFIGLPESNAACPSERVHEDREATTKILDHLEVEAEPTAVFRLGRYDPQRTTPRPLKVVMPTPTHQHVALGGWKHERARLRSQQNMARLFIRPALTKEQLKKEYEERVRKRQQIPAPVAPAVQLPQANAATPANKVGPQFWELSLKCDELDEELVRKTGAEILQKYNALAEETKKSLEPYLAFFYLRGGHFAEKVLCMNAEIKKLRKQNGTTGGGLQQQDTKEMLMKAINMW